MFSPALAARYDGAMGPTCEIHFSADAESVLLVVDSVLASAANSIERTRNGRAWDVWVNGRPIHAFVNAASSAIKLSAGCNQAEDHALLRQLSNELAKAVNGAASEPTIEACATNDTVCS